MSVKVLRSIKVQNILPYATVNGTWYCQRNQSTRSNFINTEDSAKLLENVSKNYSALNDIMTLGMHKKWRKTLVNSLEVADQSKILDLAGGTGMNAIQLLEKVKYLDSNSNFSITLLDSDRQRLKVGMDKIEEMGYNQKCVKFIEGDIHRLPFENDSFDSIVMFLTIRQNVNSEVVFREVNRVLRPKGKLYIVDFCNSKNPKIIQRLYSNFLDYVSSTIERVYFGRELENSAHLSKEIRSMPSKDELHALLKDSNFQNIEFQPLSLGIAGMTTGLKVDTVKSGDTEVDDMPLSMEILSEEDSTSIHQLEIKLPYQSSA